MATEEQAIISTGGYYAAGVLMLLLFVAQLQYEESTLQTTLLVAVLGSFVFETAWFSSKASAQTDAYYVAGRTAPMLIQSLIQVLEILPPTQSLLLFGLWSVHGTEAATISAAYVFGFIILQLYVAPYLREFGTYTLPDFMGTRYGGNFVRVGAACLLAVSTFADCFVQFRYLSTVGARIFGTSVFGLAARLFSALPVLTLVFDNSRAWRSGEYYPAALALLLTGGIVATWRGDSEGSNVQTHLPVSASLVWVFFNVAGTLLHRPLIRYYTTPRTEDARRAAILTTVLLVIWLLVLRGCGVAANRCEQPARRPADSGGPGYIPGHEFGVFECADERGVSFAATAMFYVASFLTVSKSLTSQLLAVANTLSHDVYYKWLDPKANTSKRLFVARLLLFLLGGAGSIGAMSVRISSLDLRMWGGGLGAAGLLPSIVLGIWWKRATKEGSIGAMTGGFIGWALVGLTSGYAPELRPHVAGTIGALTGFFAHTIVSQLSPPPDEATLQLLDDIHIPASADEDKTS